MHRDVFSLAQDQYTLWCAPLGLQSQLRNARERKSKAWEISCQEQRHFDARKNEWPPPSVGGLVSRQTLVVEIPSRITWGNSPAAPGVAAAECSMGTLLPWPTPPGG